MRGGLAPSAGGAARGKHVEEQAQPLGAKISLAGSENHGPQVSSCRDWILPPTSMNLEVSGFFPMASNEEPGLANTLIRGLRPYIEDPLKSPDFSPTEAVR